MHVLLGILTSEWRSSHVDLAKLARFIISFADSLQAAVRSIPDNRKATPESSNQELFNLRRLLKRHRTFADFESVVYWPRMLSLQSRMYLQSSEHEQGETARYFAPGRRRYGNALSRAQEYPSPHFGPSHTSL